MKKIVKSFILIIILSLAVEAVLFNCKFFFSCSSNPEKVSFETGNGIAEENGGYFIKDYNNSFIEIKSINKDIKYFYIDAACSDPRGYEDICNIQIYAVDEGNSNYYKLGKLETYSSSERSKYVRIHSYGKVKSLKIVFDADTNSELKLNDVVINAKVPFSFSVIRFLLVLLFILLIYLFKPSSEIYSYKFGKASSKRFLKQSVIVAVIILLNISVLYGMSKTNASFVDPPWYHHTQYQQLAHSISHGKVNLDIDGAEILEKMENPYDTELREQEAGSVNHKAWDTAYFQGKFYVYFGIVPELIFYLPYFALTGNDFSNSTAIFLCCSGIVIASFYLMKKIINRYFVNTSFGMYVFLSVIFANSIGTLHMAFYPSFYYLPIASALMFTLFGLAFWLDSAEKWRQEQESGKRNISALISLCIGSLCMALTAGCRPQFLIASFLIFPIFWKILFNEKKLFIRQNYIKAFCIAVPYIVVAAGVMYYNYIRFGSPFDFGANYNLTTNDMTLRKMNLGRIPDALFMYLFQLPNLSLVFPFIKSAPMQSDYFGKTIYEATYGGVFFTHIFLLILPFAAKVKKQLKDKELLSFVLLGVLFAVIIAVADAQMAGILGRYTSDFTWLLYLCAVIVFLQLFHSAENSAKRKKLITVMLACGICSFIMDLCIGIAQSDLYYYSTEAFFVIKNLFI